MHVLWGGVAILGVIAAGCGTSEKVIYAKLPVAERISCTAGAGNGPNKYPVGPLPDGANVFFVVERENSQALFAGQGHHGRLEIGAAWCEDAERINDYHHRFLGEESDDGGVEMQRALYEGTCTMTLQACVEAERDGRHEPYPLMWAGAHADSEVRGSPSRVPKSTQRLGWLRLIDLAEHETLVRVAAWVHEEATVNGNFMGRYSVAGAGTYSKPWRVNNSKSAENLVLSAIGWRVDRNGEPEETDVVDYTNRDNRCGDRPNLDEENALASDCEHSEACDDTCRSPEQLICGEQFRPPISCDGEEAWR